MKALEEEEPGGVGKAEPCEDRTLAGVGPASCGEAEDILGKA